MDAMERRQVRGSALLLSGRGLDLALSAATQVIIVRVLSKADYGAFAYALALAAIGQTLLSLGQGQLLSRFMAMYEEQRDYARMFGAMFIAVATIVVTSVVSIGALYMWSHQLVASSVHSQGGVKLVLILAFLAPVAALDQVCVALFAVFSRPTAIFVRKYVLAPGLRLAVVLVLAVTGAGVTFVAVGYLVTSAGGLLLYVGVLVVVLRTQGLFGQISPRRVILPFRAVFSFSFPLITSQLAVLSLTVGGVFVLARVHSTTAVADYRSVFTAAQLNTAVQQAFAILFLPLAARLFTRGNIDGLRDSYWHTAAVVAVLTFPIFALTGPLAPVTTVSLFGDRYAASATVLAVLAVGYYVNVSLGFNAYALQVCGRNPVPGGGECGRHRGQPGPVLGAGAPAVRGRCGGRERGRVDRAEPGQPVGATPQPALWVPAPRLPALLCVDCGYSRSAVGDAAPGASAGGCGGGCRHGRVGRGVGGQSGPPAARWRRSPSYAASRWSPRHVDVSPLHVDLSAPHLRIVGRVAVSANLATATLHTVETWLLCTESASGGNPGRALFAEKNRHVTITLRRTPTMLCLAGHFLHKWVVVRIRGGAM